MTRIVTSIPGPVQASDKPKLPPGKAPRMIVNVEMDDRCYLFPDGKLLSHLAVLVFGPGEIRLDGVFVFNESRLEPEVGTFDADIIAQFGRAILDAVFQGKSQYVLTESVKIGIVFNPNGFLLRFGEGDALKEVFISVTAIIRLARGLLTAVDRVSAQPAN